MICTIRLGPGADQQVFAVVKKRLDEWGDNFKIL
jgi:hypothetical protein